MSNEETVTFEFPRELVEKRFPFEGSPEVYRDRAASGKCLPMVEAQYLLCAQILEWQRANRYRVTPETPNGTEVEIVEEPQLVPVFLVGPDPLDPDDYAVIVTAEGKLFGNKWEELRLVELVRKEGSDE